MSFASMSPVEIATGITSLAIALIFTLLGLRLLGKYRRTKELVLLTFSLTFLIFQFHRTSIALSFFLYGFWGLQLDPRAYLFLHLGTVPFFVFFLILSFIQLLYPHHFRKMLPIAVIALLGYEIPFLAFLVIDPTFIGSITDHFVVRMSPVLSTINIIIIPIVFVVSFVYARFASSEQDRETRFRGKSAQVAIALYLVSMVTGALFSAFWWGIIVYSILAVASGLGFYSMFFLPKWVTRRIKETNGPGRPNENLNLDSDTNRM